MSTIFSDIAGFCPSEFDSAVLIGCGSSFVPSRCSGILSKQWHLVEADPDLVDRLEASCSPPEVVSHNLLITPTGEPTDFYRYSWPFISSPLPIATASAIYPKLRVLESLKPPVAALQVFLGNLPLPDGGNHLLVIDLPGQEAALFSALPDRSLDRWAWIAIRGATNPPQQGANPIADACRAMATLHYEQVELGEAADPAWPVLLFRRDPVKAAMQAELDSRASFLVDKASEIHRQNQRIRELEGQVATASTERDTLAAEKTALDTRLSTLSSDNDTLATSNSLLATERDTLAAEKNALDARLSTLSSDNDTLATSNSLLATEREALASDLSAKTTLLDVLTKGRVAQDKQMEKILEENASLTKERDGFLAKIQELEAQLAKSHEHSKLIDEEFGKAEGQLELIKDIFLREALR